MAADTRPYKSKEQDGQGNEIILRDQQLVEQGNATTMPSGACFETLDVDNRPVKIPRDNMMNIVLECIGIILNDSSKNLGTNVQKALGLQGNTIGHSTVVDFASVLGADVVPINRYTQINSTNFPYRDTIRMFKLYHNAGETYDGFWPSIDIDDGCCGIISTKGSNFGQVNIILYSLTGGEIYYNYKNESGWKYTSGADWERVDNFGCNSLSSLASGLGVYRDIISIEANGTYSIPFVEHYAVYAGYVGGSALYSVGVSGNTGHEIFHESGCPVIYQAQSKLKNTSNNTVTFFLCVISFKA